MRRFFGLSAALLCSFALVPVLFAVNGCSISCTLEIRTAIVVTVLDSLSGGPPSTGQAIVVVVDGNFRDSTSLTLPDNRVGLLGERAGRYRVEVRADGYQPWFMDNVRVTADECHVQTVEVRARLQRL